MKRYIIKDKITLKEFLEMLEKDNISQIERITCFNDVMEVLAE